MRVGVALYGLGTVGAGLADILTARRRELNDRHGLELELRHVVVRNPAAPRRTSAVPTDLLTADREAPRADSGVDVVVEVMGGLEPAGSVVREALASGRHVVTANKALIAEHGAELEALAAAND